MSAELERALDSLGLRDPHVLLTRVLEVDLDFRPYRFSGGRMDAARPAMMRRRPAPPCARLFRQMRSHWTRTGLGRVAARLRRAEAAAAAAPGEPAPLRLTGVLKLISNRPEEAIADLEEALRLDPGWPEGPRWLGEARLVLGDPEGALPPLERAAALAPGDPWAWAWLSAAQEGLGRRAAALRSLRAAESLAPRSAEIKVLLGLREPAALDAAVRLSPRSFWPRALRARAASLAGRRRDALRDWDAALRLDPRCPWAYVLRSWERRRLGDEKGAQRDMRAAVDLEPGCIVGFAREVGERGSLPYHPFGAPTEWIARQLPVLRRQLGEGPRAAWILSILCDYRFSYEIALPEIRRGLELDPENYLLWAFLARAYGALGRRRMPAMREAIDRAVRLSPGAGWLYAWRAEILKRSGDPEGALRDLTRAVRLDPIYPINFCWRGGNRRVLGDLRGALKDQDRALDLIRELGEDYDFLFGERKAVLCALGQPLAAVREYAEKACASASFPWAQDVPPARAAAELRRLRRAAPGEPRISAVLADVLLRAGDPAGAEREAVRALGARPPCALARGVRAEALLRLGRPAQALREADAAVALRPLSPRFYSARINVLLALGRAREAIADIDRFLVLMWRSEGYYVLRARLRRRLGEARAARAELDALLAVNPRSPWARWERFLCGVALGEPSASWQKDLRLALLTEGLRCGTRHAYFTLDLETALAEDVRDLSARGRRGLALAARGIVRAASGRSADAERDWTAALLADRSCAWLGAWRAEQELKAGRVREALAHLKSARAASPRMAWIDALAARARVELGDFVRAERGLDRALRLDPELWQAWAERAWLKRRRGDFKGAVADLGRARDLDGRHAWVHAWRGEALLRLGRPAEALRDLDEALVLHEGYEDARLWREAAASELARLVRP